MQLMGQDPVCQIAQKGYHRYTEKHAEYSADLSADGDGDDDPQRL